MGKTTKQPKIAAEVLDRPSDGAGEAPKYTWAQLDAAIPPPTAKDREVFDVPSATLDHQRMGAEIASARILTDAQRWLGQLHDFTAHAPDAAEKVLGFDPALIRVFAARAKELRGLVGASEGSASTRRLRRSAAEAIVDATVKASRGRYREVLAALSGAVMVDPARRAQVAGLRSEPGIAVLARDLRSLARLVEDAVASGSPVRVRALGRGLSDAVAKELGRLAAQVEGALDGVSGGNRRGEVSQAEIDQVDGVMLSLMEELMGLFPSGRGDGVPVLAPLATRRFFSSSSRRRAPAPDPVPTPTPDPV